jgi:biopolymer transport protein ExbB
MISFALHNLEHMAPILILMVMATVIIIERVKALLLTYPLNGRTSFFEKIRNLVMSDRIAEAVALCDQFRGKPVATIVKEGLLRAHQPEEVVSHGLEIAVSECSDRLKARTGYLSMIANVSTLLGLIGTILGLVQSFEAVGSANAQQRSALLAQGISTAMNHTLWGLSVAVPCMVAFSFLMNKTNKIKSEMDRAAVRTLDILKQSYLNGPDEGEPPQNVHHHGNGGVKRHGHKRSA